MRYLFMLFFFVSGFMLSQNSKINLTLEQSIKIALENNHDLKQVKLDKQKADEQIRQTFGESVLPSIDGTVTYSRAVKRPEFFLETPFFTGTIPSGTSNNLVAGVQLDQPVATASMFLATKISKTFAEIANYNQQYSESELVMKVKDSYYTYLVAKEYIALAQLQMKRAEENLKNTKSMFSVGRVSEYDQIKANVQYKNTLPVVTESENQLKLAANNLKLILGWDLKTEIESKEVLTFQENNGQDYSSAFSRMMNSNYMIKQSEAQMKMRDLSTDYQYSQHFPELHAFGNWQMQAQENDDRSFTDWRYLNSLTVGLNLRLSIFKGFSIDSKYQQAKIDFEKSVEADIKTKSELNRDLENTILSIEKTKEQIASYKATVDEAERGYQIATKRYSSGLSTQIEITDALVSVTQAHYNLVNTIYQFNLLNARLDLLLGKPIEEVIH